uniref:hypothetical protein n=1 Tax=Polynucleobacter sp. TaxID=2029855 RepID=UPI0040474049
MAWGRRAFIPQQTRTYVRTANRRSVGTKSVVPVTSKQAERNLAKRVLQLSRLVKVQKPELKLFEAALSFTNVADTVGGIAALTSMGAGTDNLQRIADEITVQSLYVQFRIDVGVSSIPEPLQPTDFIRCFVVQDMQQVADTAPTPAQIFQITSSPQTPLLNSDTLGRFKVLYQSPLFQGSRLGWTAVSGANRIYWANTQSNVADKYMPLNFKVRFNGSSGSDIQKNGIYAVVLSSIPGDTLEVDGYFRLQFYDA